MGRSIQEIKTESQLNRKRQEKRKREVFWKRKRCLNITYKGKIYHNINQNPIHAIAVQREKEPIVAGPPHHLYFHTLQ
jgi:hypothetical protein